MAIRNFRDLTVWNKAMDLAAEVYGLVEGFPSREAYGLVSQITRSAASVPANIAEGHARATKKDYAHFLSIAQGSLAETQTFLLLAVRVGYVTEERVEAALALADEVARMLGTLRTRLRTG
ncbi:MAG: four helix bundle protein [Chloroflexi bacterium]|nr:four helix bundle protein [Chloroflexota bacterium]